MMLPKHDLNALARGPARQALKPARRGLAQVTDGAPHPSTAASALRIEPFLLEDIAPGKTPEEMKRLPQFTLSRKHGFLPRQDPLHKMPKDFDGLDSLLNRMTIKQYDAQGKHTGPGLLALGQLGDAVKHELKVGGAEDAAVDRAIESGDQHLLSALFRDYCFLTSAYLLEPTDQSYRSTGLYHPGREVLLAQLALPMVKLAKALEHKPFMSYDAYASANYKVLSEDHQGPAGRYSFENLALVRSFEDPRGSEAGFILTHIVMNGFSGHAVSATEDALAAAAARDMPAFESAMEHLLTTFRKINLAMEDMWRVSKPGEYHNFRSFIYGLAPKNNNPMFPKGVVYEGVSDEPQFHRGESGANDSLIPMLDNLLEVTASLPETPLTKELREFRTYRPKTQRDYVRLLELRASTAKVKEFAMNGTPRAKALYLLLVDQNREVRWRHWCFAREYIIKRTKFAFATGGSKMLSYLPHNLTVVLDFLDESCANFSDGDGGALRAGDARDQALLTDVQEAAQRAVAQRRALERELEALRKEAEEDQKKRGENAAPGMLSNEEDRPPKRGWVGCDGVG